MRVLVLAVMLAGCGRIGFDRAGDDDDVADDMPAGAMSLELLAGDIGGLGNVDGPAPDARFFSPSATAVDAAGNVYVADRGNYTVRKISTTGAVTTLAGTADRPGYDDGIGAAARFFELSGIAVDGAGNVYVSDNFEHTIRRISPAGEVKPIAGRTGDAGSADGPGDSTARFNAPIGIAASADGTIYVADQISNTIRKIAPDRTVSTLAGLAMSAGSDDGKGQIARFFSPSAVAVDGDQNVYVADTGNCTIRKIAADGTVTTLAGKARQCGTADGSGAAARFVANNGIAVDKNGVVYVTDTLNATLRKITAAGVVTTIVGETGVPGSSDGTGRAAHFDSPGCLSLDAAGRVYVPDRNNHTIRVVTPAGVVTTLAGLASKPGSTDATGAAARFNRPGGLAVDPASQVYVADQGNHVVRKITSRGEVTTFAGSAGVPGAVDGTGGAARLQGPSGLDLDAEGNLYVTDESCTIRKITSRGEVTTFAGTATLCATVDGTGAAARFVKPYDVAVGGDGNVYVGDLSEFTIRKISARVVTTFAGRAATGGSSDGVGAAARFQSPAGLTVDDTGTVHVVDAENYSLRKIAADGTVSTFAGRAGEHGNVDAAGSAARFAFVPEDRTTAVLHPAIDKHGNLYVADPGNHTIRKVAPDGTVTTLAGTAGKSGIALGAEPRFARPASVAIVDDALVITDLNAVLLLRHAVR